MKLHGRMELVLIIAIAAGVGVCRCAPATHPLTIVVVSTPFGTVEEAAGAEARVDWRDSDTRDDDACTESFAALELRRHLAPCLRRPESAIAISANGEIPARGDCIVIGSVISNPAIARLERARAPELADDPQAYRIFVVRDHGRRIWVVGSASRIGTLYGVYGLLDLMGVRFFDPGSRGIVLPARSTKLPERLSVSSRPAFATRGFWAWEARGNPDFFRWMARNRMNYWTAVEHDLPLLRKLGIRLVAGGHMIQKVALDPEEYFRTHPEWFGLVQGKRSPDIGFETGDNFCTSNSDAKAELAHNVVKELVSGRWREADQLALWMLDDGHWCECDRCDAIGSPTDRLLDLSKVVLDSLDTAHRSGRLRDAVKVSSLAFLETEPPPTRPLPSGFDLDRFAMTFYPIDRCYAHALGDPACTEINRDIAARLTAWTDGKPRPYPGAMEVGEYYNLDTFKSLPVVLTRIIASDVPWYHRHGVRDFHFMHVLTEKWGPWALDHWLLSRLLWEPDAPAEPLVHDYFARRYPRTHERMERVHRNLEIAFANAKILTHRVRANSQMFQMRSQLRNGALVFPLDHFHEESLHPSANDAPDLADIDAAMAGVRSDMAGALSEGRDPAERARLEEDAARIDYGDATLAFYSALLRLHERHWSGRAAEAAAYWPALEAAATRLRAIRDMTTGAGTHADAADAFQATRLTEVYEKYRALYDPRGGP